MAFKNLTLVAETTTDSGTQQGITLNGKAVGRRSFADAGYTAGDTCMYSLIQGNDLEYGIGTFQGGSDFDRAPTPIASTNGGARINLDGTEATVAVAPIGEKLVTEDANGDLFFGDGTEANFSTSNTKLLFYSSF
jgi:hypothetical protein